MSERDTSSAEELLEGLDRLPSPPARTSGDQLPVRWSEEENQLLERISRERGDKVRELLRGLVKKSLQDAERALRESDADPPADEPDRPPSD